MDGRLDGGDALGGFRFTRRGVLGAALAGGGVVLMGGVAGGGGLRALRGTAVRVPGLRVLSDHEHRTLAALARTHLPPGGAFGPGADDVDLGVAFDEFLRDEPAANVRDLKRALLLIEYGPVLFDRRLATFSNLDDAGRLAHWQGWLTSPSVLRRQAATAFRKFLSIVFYDREEVWAHIGYPGPARPAR